MHGDPRCAHPGCDLAATDVAVVGSDWEDAASGSGLFLCDGHARAYVPDGAERDAIRRVSSVSPRTTSRPAEGTTR